MTVTIPEFSLKQLMSSLGMEPPVTSNRSSDRMLPAKAQDWRTPAGAK